VTLYGSTPEPDADHTTTTPPAIPYQHVGSEDVRALGAWAGTDVAASEPALSGAAHDVLTPADGGVASGVEAEGPAATDTAVVQSVEPDGEPAVPDLQNVDVAGFADADVDSEIPPWDRRPLMVVLASAAALVLLAVLSGMASASMFRGEPAAWQQPGTGPAGPGGTPSPGPAAPPPAEETVTLSGVGDVIMGTSPSSLPPNEGAGFFDEVKAALAADLVMGNLDQPITVDTGRVKCAEGSTGCHQFYLPPSYAQRLKEGGFDLVSLANNHTHDMGAEGLRNTRTALDAAGVMHTGGVDQITTVDVKGIKVAVLGFSVYSWGANLNKIPEAEALVREAAAEADIVVIQMQGGAEGTDKAHVRGGTEMFLGENRGDLIKFSHAVVDAGADVVFGHGPHVMRGMEFYKGRLIAYSLGNFCGYKTLSSSGFAGVGGVLKVTLKRDGSWSRGELVPTEMVRGGYPAPDPDKRALAFVNDLSQDDFGAAAATISTTDGRITPPATP
jgi:hypothetical protein